MPSSPLARREPGDPDRRRARASAHHDRRPVSAPSPSTSNRAVRVLWLIKGLGPGGAERLLASQAATTDHDAFTISAAYLVPWKDHLVGDLTSHGIDVVCLHGEREWDLRWVARLRALILRRRIEVVHVHSPYVAALTRLVVRTLPRRSRPAIVVTEHNRWPRHARVTRLANRFTIFLDDADLAVSEDVRTTMGVRARDGVEVVVHGVDLAAVRSAAEHRSEVRSELGIADDDVVVGIVANFRAEKAYDTLLAAAVEATDVAGDRPLRFVAVGQGPLEAEIRARHAASGLGDRFLLTGYRPDAVRVMAAFDVFTLTSRHEGLPVALMDALALGLPVVATRVGGIPEAVTDGVEGILVPVDDHARLAAGYLDLAADPGRRAAMGAAARRRGDDFDVARSTARIEAIYRDLATSSASSRRS